MNHVRRPRSEYEALIARKHDLGLTYQQLADESGVPISTLALWGRRMKANEPTQASAFVELKTSAADGGVEVILPNGVRIGVRRGFDRELLNEVVTAFGCCPSRRPHAFSCTASPSPSARPMTASPRSFART